MKKTITLFALALLSIININAQRKLDSLTYENTQDINFFKNVKNRTLIQKYKTINENIIQVGDTVILGNPTNQELSSKTYTGSYGNKARGGISQTRSTTKKTYEFIKMGRPSGIGSIMSSMDGDSQVMASNSLKNTKVFIKPKCLSVHFSQNHNKV